MIVFHGSNMEIRSPNVSFSKNYLDFGKGFYVTSYQIQAERWALRKASRYNGEPTVNIYSLADELSKFKVLNFDNENEKWLDFVCACRKGEDINNAYDIIIGNVANDDVFKTIDMYSRGLWDKQRTIEELRYFKMNDQICFVNQEIISEVLKFEKSYCVEEK